MSSSHQTLGRMLGKYPKAIGFLFKYIQTNFFITIPKSDAFILELLTITFIFQCFITHDTLCVCPKKESYSQALTSLYFHSLTFRSSPADKMRLSSANSHQLTAWSCPSKIYFISTSTPIPSACRPAVSKRRRRSEKSQMRIV